MNGDNSQGFLPFDTARLRVEQFERGDAAAFATYRSDPGTARYQGWSVPYPLAAAHDLIDEQSDRTEPTAGHWLQIAIRRDGDLIGDIGIHVSDDALIASIGYTLAPGQRGHGFATEAVGALIRRLFERTTVIVITASTDPANVSSRRLLERLGFHLDVDAEPMDPDFPDDLLYRLPKSDVASPPSEHSEQ